MYVPEVSPVIPVVKLPGVAITSPAGPEIFVHKVVTIVAPPLPVAVPTTDAVVTPTPSVWLALTVTVGAIVAEAVTVVAELPLRPFEAKAFSVNT